MALKLIFEWNKRRISFIEGASIFIASIIVTLVSSFIEYRIGKTLIFLKETE
jgi:hypothetical protein